MFADSYYTTNKYDMNIYNRYNIINVTDGGNARYVDYSFGTWKLENTFYYLIPIEFKLI